MNRFFVPAEDVGENSIYMYDREDLHHMIKVLRLSAGDHVEISDSVKWEYEAEIISLDKDQAQLRILDKQKFTTEPDVNVTLFQGIPKQGKMELIVQKSVELGVCSIVPVFMKRTVVADKGNFGKKTARWQKVAAESVKQCKRGRIPEVSDPVRFPDMMSGLGKFDLVLFPYENEEGTTMKDVLRDFMFCGDHKNADIAVIIGPEGGFSDEEAAEIVSSGGRSLSLGKTTLRTETAGMAAISMIMYEMEL